MFEDFNELSEFASTTETEKIDDSSFKKQALSSVQQRNDHYCSFLGKYVTEYGNKAKATRRMKRWFFFIIMFLLVAVSIVCIIAVYRISGHQKTTCSDIANMITAMTGIISSFLILPRIIAENLFPPKEDDKTSAIFDSMIKYDLELEKIYTYGLHNPHVDGCPDGQKKESD